MIVVLPPLNLSCEEKSQTLAKNECIYVCDMRKIKTKDHVY